MWTQIRLLLQEQSDLDLQFVEEASKTFKQTTKADNLCCIGPLRVNKCDFQLIYGNNFHEMHARLKQLVNHVNFNIT